MRDHHTQPKTVHYHANQGRDWGDCATFVPQTNHPTRARHHRRLTKASGVRLGYVIRDTERNNTGQTFAYPDGWTWHRNP